MDHVDSARKKVISHIQDPLVCEQQFTERDGRTIWETDPQAAPMERKRLLDLMDASRQWGDEQKQALAQIAASTVEPVRYRTRAIYLIGNCGLRGYWEMLAFLLRNDSNWVIRTSAARALGKLGVRSTMPALYETVLYAEKKGGEEALFLRHVCIWAIYRILFRYDSGYLPHSHLGWWKRMKPTRDLINAWVRGEQIPDSDGFGNVAR